MCLYVPISLPRYIKIHIKIVLMCQLITKTCFFLFEAAFQNTDYVHLLIIGLNFSLKRSGKKTTMTYMIIINFLFLFFFFFLGGGGGGGIGLSGHLLKTAVNISAYYRTAGHLRDGR